MARALKTRAVKSGSRDKAKKLIKKTASKKLSAVAPKVKQVVKKVEVAAEVMPAPVEKKNVSQKLLETIERRKLERAKQGAFLAKRPGRRGRRPKNVEYTPSNNEEEQFVYESEYERLEYDTGIRLKDHSEDASGGLERVEDFDEELNFDW